MFEDENGLIARHWDIWLLVTGLGLGWALALGGHAWQEADCGPIGQETTLLALLLFFSYVLLRVLRRRDQSVQLLGVRCIQVSALVALVIVICFVLVYSVNLLQTVRQETELSDDARCVDDSLTVSAVALAVVGIVSSTFQTVALIHIVYMRFVFLKPKPVGFGKHSPLVRYVRTKHGFTVPMVLYMLPDSVLTIIYSHGNAVDLGQLLRQGKLRGLRDQLRVNVIAYDYAGYGFAGGASSEENFNASLEAVYEVATQVLLIPKETILLYGRSIGTCPTTTLAASLGRNSLAGVILESPPLSLLRTLRCVNRIPFTLPFDMFSSIDRIHDIEVPIYFIHGTDDTTVPLSHGKQLMARCKEGVAYDSPWWVEAAGHNSMPEVWFFPAPERLNREEFEQYQERCNDVDTSNALNLEHKRRLRAFLQFCQDDLALRRPKSAESPSRRGHGNRSSNTPTSGEERVGPAGITPDPRNRASTEEVKIQLIQDDHKNNTKTMVGPSLD